MTFKLRFLALPAAALGLVLAATSIGGQSVRTAYALTNCSVSDTSFDAEEKRFAELINDYRIANKLSKLTVSVNLNRAATWHGGDMAAKNYFSHTDSLGRSAEIRGQQCGTLSGIGENIAAGKSRDTAQEAFDAWKASAGHNKNMLYASYKQIGIARVYSASSQWGWYWVTDFSLNSDDTDALGGGGSEATSTPSNTATTTPSATATPAVTSTPTTVSAAAQISSPAPGSKLTSTTVTFRWDKVTGAKKYQIYVGTTPGGYNVRNVATTSTSLKLSGLPRGGVPVYVRLWTLVGTTWKYVDYTYTSAR